MKKQKSLKYFAMGVGSTLNLLPNSSQFFQSPPFSSVAEALEHDWKQIGFDIQKGIEFCETEIQTGKENGIEE